MSRSAVDGIVPVGTYILIYERAYLGGSHDELVQLEARTMEEALDEAARVLVDVVLEDGSFMSFDSDMGNIYQARVIGVGEISQTLFPEEWPTPALRDAYDRARREQDERVERVARLQRYESCLTSLLEFGTAAKCSACLHPIEFHDEYNQCNVSRCQCSGPVDGAR